MSRFAGRLSRLEGRLGGCPGCAERLPLIEIVSPRRRSIAGKDTDTTPCPECGKPRELISISVAFDLFPTDEDEHTAPGTPQREREQTPAR